MVNFGCIKEGCTKHPSKGDTIIRTNAKDVPFEGMCKQHLMEDQYGTGAIVPEDRKLR